jgi:undecaprenyl diphosphate synthase
MTLQEDQLLPQHVAIIMDGNNRFAKKMQMQKGDGHREGKNVLIRLLSIVKVSA